MCSLSPDSVDAGASGKDSCVICVVGTDIFGKAGQRPCLTDNKFGSVEPLFGKSLYKPVYKISERPDRGQSAVCLLRARFKADMGKFVFLTVFFKAVDYLDRPVKNGFKRHHTIDVGILGGVDVKEVEAAFHIVDI